MIVNPLANPPVRESKMLGHVDLISQERSRRFLLQQTQHRIGGFGKEPGSIPGKSSFTSIDSCPKSLTTV